MTTTARRIGLGLGALVLAVGLGAGVYVAAQDQNTPGEPRGFGGWRRHGPMGPRSDMGPLGMLPLGRLNLTDAQRTQVRTLLDAHRAATQPTFDRARTAREALHAATTSSTVDEAAIRARSAELASAEADLAVARAQLQADIAKLLTPEQRTQLEQMRSRQAGRMSDRMGRMRDRQQQPPAR